MEAPVSEPPKAVEYRILNKPWVREYFKSMTLKLVEETQEIDTLFFLDRSARPIAHLYRRVFTALHPDRPRPKIRYLNIGGEKTIASKIPLTKEDFIKRYGAENIEEAERLLRSSQGQRKMIVDDLMSTGKTHLIARHLVNALDPDSQYRGFIFDRDQELYIMPWSGFNTFVQNRTSDWEDPAFLTKRDSHPKRREEGIQLRAELERLAGEIAAEKGVTLPPIYPYWKKPTQ